MVLEALKPAVPRSIQFDERNKRIALEVGEEDLAVAIGRKGQNARLTSRLIGWRIDIIRVAAVSNTMGDKVKAAAGSLHSALGLPDDVAMRLVEKGLNSIELLDTVDEETLIGEGFTLDEAQDILNRVRQAGSSAAPQA
jgi:N utilization substance protein A